MKFHSFPVWIHTGIAGSAPYGFYTGIRMEYIRRELLFGRIVGEELSGEKFTGKK
jgi:hypothetical protein